MSLSSSVLKYVILFQEHFCFHVPASVRVRPRGGADGAGARPRMPGVVGGRPLRGGGRGRAGKEEKRKKQPSQVYVASKQVDTLLKKAPAFSEVATLLRFYSIKNESF